MLSFSRGAVLLLSLAGPTAAHRMVAQEVLLSSEGPAAAGRVVAKENSSLQLAHTRTAGNGEFVDLTFYLAQEHVKKKMAEENIKCCCDASGTSRLNHKIHTFFNEEAVKARTKRCVMYLRTDKCGDHHPDWAKFSLSAYTTAGIPCQYEAKDIDAVYEHIGSPVEYCKAGNIDVEHGHLEPPAIMMGKQFQVKCDTNYEPEQKAIKCMYGSAEEGKLSKPPVCKMVCPATASSDLEGSPKVSKAGLGKAGTVSCEDGWVPEPDVVPICQMDKTFEPKPACKKQPDYCVSQTLLLPGKPTVPAASLGKYVHVTCEQQGWDSSFQRVECTTGGKYEPEPVCSKVQAFCKSTNKKELPGAPQLMAAAVGEPMEVLLCPEPGYEMVEGAAATCGEDGEPVFDEDKPLCKKNKHFCTYLDFGAQGGLELSSRDAELGQDVTVTCTETGFHPSVEIVTCKESEEFVPEPECVVD